MVMVMRKRWRRTRRRRRMVMMSAGLNGKVLDLRARGMGFDSRYTGHV
jgi:hypothetical protein